MRRGDRPRADATLGHLLVTRFSVRLHAGSPTPADAWLRARSALFMRYTLPSVTAQTQPPDAWLLVCGPLPRWLSDELAVLSADAPWIRPVETADTFSPGLARELVKEALPPGLDRVITTRLDNDDIIAADYLAAVRQAAANGDGFVNFTHGLQLAGGRLYHRSDPSNAFASLAEPADALRTVYVAQHPDLAQHGPLRQVHTRPMWMQVIHGENVGNVARGIRADPRRIRSTFDAPLALEPTTTLRLRADQVLDAVRLGARVLGKPHRIRWAFRVLRPPAPRQDSGL